MSGSHTALLALAAELSSAAKRPVDPAGLHWWMTRLVSLGRGWPFLVEVITTAAIGSETEWPDRLKEAEVLMPPALKRTRTLDDVRHMAGEPASVAVRPGFEQWMTKVESEEAFETMYPMRSAKDRGLRRTRSYELLESAKRLGVDLTDTLQVAWSYVWDYTMVLNVGWARLRHGEEWWRACVATRVFERGVADVAAVLKRVSDLVKTYEVAFPRAWFLELQVVTGYWTVLPGFDVSEEARDWAAGGRPHPTYGPDFETTARTVLKMTPEAGNWVPFDTYVQSGEWATAGASSVGRVEYYVDGAVKHFKARKNNVLDVVPMTEIMDVARTNGQANVAIEKDETAKRRLAVAGDLGTYMRMAWVDKIAGDVYRQWPGNTMGEDLNDMSDRMADMLWQLSERYGLSFDYKAYDHQAQLSEVMAIVELWLAAARTVVPSHGLAEFDDIARHMIDDFKTAVLEWRASRKMRSTWRVGVGDSDGALEAAALETALPIGGDWMVVLVRGRGDISLSDYKAGARDRGEPIAAGSVPITGGLPSGIRITSLVGNAWNTVITAMVMSVLQSIGVNTVALGRWVRGDDTGVTSETWAEAMSVVLGYEASDVEFGRGKFSIWRGAIEFLRQWYDGPNREISAYANRAAVGLTQRKPWSNEPWTPESVIVALAQVRDTLARRGDDASRLSVCWNVIAERWCKVRKVDRRWLGAPRVAGGLGLETGRWWPSRSWPTADVRLEFVRATSRQETVLYTLCHKYRVTPIESRVTLVADELRSSRVVADNVPQVASVAREDWDAKFRAMSVTWRKIPVARLMFADDSGLAALSLMPNAVAMYYAEFAPGPDYGAWVGGKTTWQEIRNAARCSGESAYKLLRSFEPHIWARLLRLERAGLRRAEALDWLLGSVAWPVLCNPVVQELVAHGASRIVGDPGSARWQPGEWVEMVVAAGTAATADLLRSSFYTSLYDW